MTNPDKQSRDSKSSTPTNPVPGSSGDVDALDCPTNEHGERFPKLFRLSSREEFAAVFDNGQVVADRTLVVHAIRTDRRFNRIGLSVSKKVGSSPTRNYWKRCIREAFRRNHRGLPTGLDIIVRPRRDAHADGKKIEDSLQRLLKKVDRQLRN